MKHSLNRKYNKYDDFSKHSSSDKTQTLFALSEEQSSEDLKYQNISLHLFCSCFNISFWFMLPHTFSIIQFASALFLPLECLTQLHTWYQFHKGYLLTQWMTWQTCLLTTVFYRYWLPVVSLIPCPSVQDVRDAQRLLQSGTLFHHLWKIEQDNEN